MKWVGYLTLNPWVAALIILLLDAMPFVVKMRVDMETRKQNKELAESDKEQLTGIIKLVMYVNAAVILAYILSGHWGGSLVLFALGLIIFIFEALKVFKEGSELI